MPRNIAAILYDARSALQVGSQGELGTLLGSSTTSGQRWERGRSAPTPKQLLRLAALVFPHDANLAAEIAAAGGSTLGQLALPAAPSSPPSPSPSLNGIDPVHVVDSVVCAAAEAMQVAPAAIRPALGAAFRRARLVRLSVEAIEAALNPPGASAEASGAPTSASRGHKTAK